MPIDGFTMRDPEDDSDRRLLEDVEQYGFHILHIGEMKPYPEFSFTVGFHYSWDAPEVLIYGLRPDPARHVLWSVARLLAAGRKLAIREPLAEILDNYTVQLIPIVESNYKDHLGYGSWFYRSIRPRTFPAVQLVWPDRSNRLPWEEGFDESFRWLQPLLDRPVDTTPVVPN